jgi:hypothetical protein
VLGIQGLSNGNFLGGELIPPLTTPTRASIESCCFGVPLDFLSPESPFPSPEILRQMFDLLAQFVNPVPLQMPDPHCLFFDCGSHALQEVREPFECISLIEISERGRDDCHDRLRCLLPRPPPAVGYTATFHIKLYSQ